MKFEDFYLKGYNWTVRYGLRAVVALLLLLLGFWLIGKIKGLLHNSLTRRNVDPSLRPFLLSVSVIFLQGLLLLAAMQVVGVQMTIFAAFVGAFGVATGLALSGTLQNFTSGVLILILKPFRVGDNIIAQGHEGIVHSIEIFYTIVTTFDNRTVILPNSKLSNEVIVNLSREGIRRLDVEIKLPFAIAFEQVRTILQNTILENKELLEEPKFHIGVSSVDADGYKVMVNTWVKPEGYQQIKLQLQQKILEDVIAGGIKLAGL
ncbi:mechanosensitive ion channel domain-containing protein [Segetibacter sp.]|jgi:small conductance mechanosensitive channel|uniref:mechanosensitive ion channel family protein n=1 Tax=Segetibacter sp. TaxID=2231182 RepID=UPI00262BB8CD|nr:mechanosensitive ion channel domain-containing protein [Segetibacter sp.]MCW3081589.1 mechanosensitive ion channel family protein [Segetibacter sp.]